MKVDVIDAWVLNASPVILYARIDRLDIIERLAPGLIVPVTVINEVKAGTHKDSTAKDSVIWASRFERSDIPVPSTVERWDLGAGESQVISFCMQGKRWAVLDDRMARRCISAHSLQMIGSLGMILRAKRLGLIEAARPWVYKLREQGMFVDVKLLEMSLSAVGDGQ
jgi:predicted nucleic acid-binding protein